MKLLNNFFFIFPLLFAMIRSQLDCGFCISGQCPDPNCRTSCESKDEQNSCGPPWYGLLDFLRAASRRWQTVVHLACRQSSKTRVVDAADAVGKICVVVPYAWVVRKHGFFVLCLSARISRPIKRTSFQVCHSEGEARGNLQHRSIVRQPAN